MCNQGGLSTLNQAVSVCSQSGLLSRAFQDGHQGVTCLVKARTLNRSLIYPLPVKGIGSVQQEGTKK